MDSDESFASTSGAYKEVDSELSLSTSQDSVNQNSDDLCELYVSTFSGSNQTTETADSQLSALLSKLNEQSFHIQKLKEERIGFLEQITQLCTSLEKKECELVELMLSYEQKVNDVACYMQEVQGLLVQLTSLFSEHTGIVVNTESQLTECPVDETTNEHRQTGIRRKGSDTSNLNGSCLQVRGSSIAWDQRGRALLHALSASVATASARNKQDTLPRNSEQSGHVTSVSRKLSSVELSTDKRKSLIAGTTRSSPTDENSTDGPELIVCNLPPFCWSPKDVLYWLTEYACLPGGCLDLAKRIQMDGQQLIDMTGTKADKVLGLSDAGLQRKFQLALEDLRVHGSPGLSRSPGPSHIRPDWVCDVWLRRNLGLAHLVPLFAVRRVDGRMLASLATFKRSTRRKGDCNGSLAHISLIPNSLNNNGSADMRLAPQGEQGIWRGASRREICRILLGLGRDNAGGKMYAVSGADVPSSAKLLLGRKEVHSLRTGIELLCRFNFNVQLLEKMQMECSTNDSNLLVWSNERVAKWLSDLGLAAFTRGIEGSGLHGAYMVLDQNFNVTRLMKSLHLPLSVATTHCLADHLHYLLQPARQREGISTKQHRLFRCRIVSRQNNNGLLQRSVTSTETLDCVPSANPVSPDPFPNLPTPSPYLTKQKCNHKLSQIIFSKSKEEVISHRDVNISSPSSTEVSVFEKPIFDHTKCPLYSSQSSPRKSDDNTSAIKCTFNNTCGDRMEKPTCLLTTPSSTDVLEAVQHLPSKGLFVPKPNAPASTIAYQKAPVQAVEKVSSYLRIVQAHHTKS